MGENGRTMGNSEFSLADVVHEAVTDLAASSRQQAASVIRLIDPSLPPTVISDPAVIRKILSELLSTALRHSSAFTVKLSVFSAGSRAPELDVNFEVTAENHLPENHFAENEFVDERRASAPLQPSAVPEPASPLPSRQLVQKIGGDMGAHSDPGRLTLWCRIPMQAPPAAGPRVAPVPGGTISKPAPKGQIRILMAEDNLINQRVGKLILERSGYKIDLVADGSEALDAHREKQYDVILMDCQMPIMDGFEATRLIRSLPLHQPIIIAVTANALVGERERCLFAGMDDYLSKPFQAEQLVSIVDKWVSAGNGKA
jgi:two-component system, sensor histidine kinase